MKPYAGFPKDLIAFITELGETNTKQWFEANRQRYEASYRDAARAYVEAMAGPLSALWPDINADPRNNGSIMRIHRDTRFSKDKSPYNPYLRMIFWQGSGKARESAGFYVGVDPKALFIGGGMFGFSPDQLKRYRAALNNPAKTRALESTIETATKAGHALGDPHLKRIPTDTPDGHSNPDLFRYKGLYAGTHLNIEPWFHTPDVIDKSMEHFKTVRPLQQWLAENVAAPS